MVMMITTTTTIQEEQKRNVSIVVIRNGQFDDGQFCLFSCPFQSIISSSSIIYHFHKMNFLIRFCVSVWWKNIANVLKSFIICGGVRRRSECLTRHQHEMKRNNWDEKGANYGHVDLHRTTHQDQKRWLSKTNRLFPVVHSHENCELVSVWTTPKIISNEICFDLCLFSYFAVDAIAATRPQK